MPVEVVRLREDRYGREHVVEVARGRTVVVARAVAGLWLDVAGDAPPLQLETVAAAEDESQVRESAAHRDRRGARLREEEMIEHAGGLVGLDRDGRRWDRAGCRRGCREPRRNQRDGFTGRSTSRRLDLGELPVPTFAIEKANRAVRLAAASTAYGASVTCTPSTKTWKRPPTEPSHRGGRRS